MKKEGTLNDYTEHNSMLPKKAVGPSLITYNVALEAWRRGISLQFYTVTVKNRMRIFYLLENEGKSYKFQYSLGGKVESEARKIVNDKSLTKQHLSAAGVSVPQGKSVDIDKGIEESLKYADELGYPVVAKPTDGRLGKGVMTDLGDENALRDALNHLKNELGYTDIIIEQYIKGDDTRVYVIDDKVAAAYKRVPLNVFGDGVSTINELVDEKKRIRKNNPYAKKHEIVINEEVLGYLTRQGYTIDSVPEKGQRIFLAERTLSSDAGEKIDITEELSDKMKETAINAVKAVPGMFMSGLDLMIDHGRNQGYVLELNANPNIAGHLYPMEGKPRGVHKAIIDHYFPETIDEKPKNNDYFVYDFDGIIDILKSGAVKSVTVPPLPKGRLRAVEVDVTGGSERLLAWIHQRAVNMRLGGEIIKMGNDEFKIKIAGRSAKVNDFMSALKQRVTSNTRLKIVDDAKLKGLYPFYFKRVGNTPVLGPSETSSRPTAIKEKKSNADLKKIKAEEKKNQVLSKELQDMKNSKSWLLTAPFRKLMSKVNKNK